MKRALMLAVPLFFLGQANGIAATIDAKLKKAVEAAFEDMLNDPYSAKYTFDRVNMRSEKVGIVCGTVNAKNQLGAYVGKRTFTAPFMKTESGYMTEPKVMDSGVTLDDMASVCGGPK